MRPVRIGSEGKIGQHFRIHAEAGGRRADLDALRELVGHAHFERDGPGDFIRAGLEALLNLLQSSFPPATSGYK